MNVLSLFDGLSSGQIALNKAGIKYDKYFSSEIDKHAIKVTQHNYPDTIQLGDVTTIKGSDLPKIDLLIGGSPCTSFSFGGKRNGMVTEDNIEILTLDHYLQLKQDGIEFKGQSYLFWEYIRLLKETNPTYFMLENVKMQKKWEDIISNTLGVKPVFINSADFSAQDRKRIYWTNFPISLDYVKNIQTVEDILEPEVDCKYVINPTKAITILDNECKRRKIGYIGTDSQANRIYSIHGKSVTLCGLAGGLGAKTGLYALPCTSPDIVKKTQNGIRFKPPMSKFYTLTTVDRHGIFTDNFIRRLTPMECERLQTVPDNYTSLSSDNIRWKMLGNGWTVDVISHIFKGIPLTKNDIFDNMPLFNNQ